MSKEEKKVAPNRIAFDPHFKRFYVTGTNQVLRGLHGVLVQKFYPVGSCFENIKHRRFSKTGHKLDGMRKRKPIRTARRAKNLGSRVDEHMRKMVQAAKGDALILRAWVDKSKETLAAHTKQRIPKNPVKRPEPEALGAIRIMLDKNWIPIDCQVPVGSADHGIASAADVRCKHAKNAKRIGIVEVKTGYDTTWLADTRQKFNAPLQDMWDTMKNKAHLQVACTALLYKASEGVLPEAFVVRASAQALTFEPLLPAMAKNLTAIGKQLVSKAE